MIGSVASMCSNEQGHYHMNSWVDGRYTISTPTFKALYTAHSLDSDMAFYLHTHSLLPILPCLLHRRPLLHFLIPLPALRIFFLPLIREVLAHNTRLVQKQPMPWHERQICVCALVSGQVWLFCLLQVAINHAKHTANLVAVAV